MKSSRRSPALAMLVVVLMAVGAGRAGAAPPMASGVVAPGVVAPGVTAPGVTAPGVVAPGVVAPRVVAPRVVEPAMVAPGVMVPEVGGTGPCLPVIGCGPLGGLSADAARLVGRAMFDAFEQWVADGATAVLERVTAKMTETTTVHLLDAAWFGDHVAVMQGLAVVILLPLVLVGLISAIVHRDMGQLVRTVAVYVPVAILGGAIALRLTDTAISMTDQVTDAVTGDLHSNTHKAMEALASAIHSLSSPVQPDLGGLLAVVVLLLMIAGALLIWIELLLRTSSIYVVVLFLPLALSGLVWRATAHWTRRMIELLVALILSKFVIVVVINLAAGMIGGSDDVGTVMSGTTLLLLAAFAPFGLLRLVPLVEAGVIGHLERLERRPVAAATRATMTVGGLLAGAAEGAAASGSVGPVAAGTDPAPPEKGGQLNGIRVPSDPAPASSGLEDASPPAQGDGPVAIRSRLVGAPAGNQSDGTVDGR